MNKIRAKLEKMLNPLRKNGSGQGALAIVLLMLLLGSVIVVPLLVFMQTGLRAGQVYESKMGEFYASDSGVEDALWRIKNAYPNLTIYFPDSPRYDSYDYGTNYSYSLPDEINNENVTVNITNIWIPKQTNIWVPKPDSSDADDVRRVVETGRLIVTGNGITLDGTTGYEIRMIYYYDTDPESDYYDPNGTNLNVDTVGVWLSGGFHHVPGAGSLAAYEPADVSLHCGGESIVWDVDELICDLPGGTGYPMMRVVSFQFTGPPAQYPSALSWAETSGVPGLFLSWDADFKPYRITSTAGNTTAEAYSIKSELRKMGSAIEGDYYASGNTLMDCSKGVGQGQRNRLYMETSTTITDDDIPVSATIEAAFLYWSGWIDYRYCFKERRKPPRWEEIPELEYPADPTRENLTTLIEQHARVNNVTFDIEGSTTEITTHEWQADENIEHPGTWSYSCFYDVTSLIKGAIDAEEIGANGAATYTVSHAVVEERPDYPLYSVDLYPTSDSTGYPLGVPSRTCGWGGVGPFDWAYAGWSMIVIYSSPETQRHQLYIFDDFAYAEEHSNVDFDDDGNEGGNITGFLAPAAITGEDYAARLTCFVGEGDLKYKNDNILLNDVELSNSASPANNVWNEASPGGILEGIDIDTFLVEYPTIEPGDTIAQVDLPTNTDSWNLVYIILSFRSDITIGGTINYLVR